jgi:uncharacterized protein YhhL (DUF1145 family)
MDQLKNIKWNALLNFTTPFALPLNFAKTLAIIVVIFLSWKNEILIYGGICTTTSVPEHKMLW